MAEDALFMVHYCAYIKRVVLTDDVIYQYRVNPHSTMKSKGTVEKTESQLSAAVMMYDSKESDDEDYKRLTELRAYNTVSIAILNAAQSHYSLKELISLYKSVCAKSEYMGYLSKREIISLSSNVSCNNTSFIFLLFFNTSLATFLPYTIILTSDYMRHYLFYSISLIY